MPALLERYPRARVVPFSSARAGQAREGRGWPSAGRSGAAALREARTVVSLDDDFLSTLPGSLRAAREFADRPRPAASSTGCGWWRAT